MSSFVSRATLGACAVLLAGAAVAADSTGTQTISASHARETYQCRPDVPVVITGSHNRLTFQGHCADVKISGSDNRLAFDSIGRLHFSGSDNSLRHSLRGPKPELSDSGSNNRIE